MKYYHELYLSENLVSKKAEILYKLEHDKSQFEKYVIAITKNEKNHLEFYNSVLLLQGAVSKEDVFIVGIADGVYGALELVEKITQEVLKRTGNVDIRNYLLKKQQEYVERSV